MYSPPRGIPTTMSELLNYKKPADKMYMTKSDIKTTLRYFYFFL